MATLPRFVVLRSSSNHKTLHYIHDEDEKKVPVAGFLKFSEEDIGSHYSKFELERAKSSQEMRASYTSDAPPTNQRKTDPKPHAPCSSPSTNLKIHVMTFRHVQLGSYASLCRKNNACKEGLHAASASSREADMMATDWDSLPMRLPRYVAFKGCNGKYLSARMIDGRVYLLFESDDLGDQTVRSDVWAKPVGIHRIISTSLFGIWRLTKDDWICPDLDNFSLYNLIKDDWYTFFWPLKVGDNLIALRSMRNKNFCRPVTAGDDITSGLKADVPTIHAEAYLEVVELVVLRKIYNVNFRLRHARVYNKKVVEMAIGEAVNHAEESHAIEVKLSYTKTRSNSWNSSFSSMLKLGVKSSIDAGLPVIADGGKIEIEFAGIVQRGRNESTVVTDSIKEAVCKVVVPAMTTVKVRLLATEAWCDVPFSYSQRDTLTTGQTITSDKDDGVYTGVNTFDFNFDTRKEKL
ncbi:uncharacterized protein Pyn_00002 [Prunus yedoensis var. nudiflora]|uniref:Agglutinin domain-containing protein n=1 Tax=Prunus yedoensis var. nudiflora TaxID=2094558 RepID=A0A314UFV1_PRUYE|nr:uncharacterized protein Pyn_00002 [Prunus yedoensis var. nudiflora]